MHEVRMYTHKSHHLTQNNTLVYSDRWDFYTYYCKKIMYQLTLTVRHSCSLYELILIECIYICTCMYTYLTFCVLICTHDMYIHSLYSRSTGLSVVSLSLHGASNLIMECHKQLLCYTYYTIYSHRSLNENLITWNIL